jgi:DNA-binding MarR family transcriptional regulator
VKKTSPRPAPVRLSADGQLWSSVVALHSQIRTAVERALQRHSRLGFSEFQALLALSEEEDGELRMQELAEKTSLNQSSATRLVGRLEQHDLTRRTLCERDRRGVYTEITEVGREVLAGAVPVYQQALTEAMDQAALEDRFKLLLGRLRTPEDAA